MHTLLSLALSLASHAVPTQDAAAQASATISIAPPQPWKVGERFAFDMEKVAEVVDEAGRKSSRGSVTRFAVECAAQAQDGGVCHWTCGATRSIGAVKQADALTQRVLALTQGLAYDVRTRPDGAPIELVDPAAARARLAELVAAVRKDVAAAGERGSGLTETLEMGVKALDGAGLETVLLREPARFFAANGLRLARGKPEEHAAKLPHPLGGDPLPSTARWTLVAHDETKHVAQLEWLESVDPALATRVTRDALAQSMTEEQRRALGDDEFLRLPVFTRFDERGKVSFDTRRGLPTSAEFVLTVVISGKSTVDTLRFQLAAEPQAR